MSTWPYDGHQYCSDPPGVSIQVVATIFTLLLRQSDLPKGRFLVLENIIGTSRTRSGVIRARWTTQLPDTRKTLSSRAKANLSFSIVHFDPAKVPFLTWSSCVFLLAPCTWSQQYTKPTPRHLNKDFEKKSKLRLHKSLFYEK